MRPGTGLRAPARRHAEGLRRGASPGAGAAAVVGALQGPGARQLVDEALAANHDLKAAAERIEQSRAQVMVARARLSPDAGVQYDASRSRSSEKSNFPVPAEFIESSSHRLVLTASWELDFWGKF